MVPAQDLRTEGEKDGNLYKICHYLGGNLILYFRTLGGVYVPDCPTSGSRVLLMKEMFNML